MIVIPQKGGGRVCAPRGHVCELNVFVLLQFCVPPPPPSLVPSSLLPPPTTTFQGVIAVVRLSQRLSAMHPREYIFKEGNISGKHKTNMKMSTKHDDMHGRSHPPILALGRDCRHLLSLPISIMDCLSCLLAGLPACQSPRELFQ